MMRIMTAVMRVNVKAKVNCVTVIAQKKLCMMRRMRRMDQVMVGMACIAIVQIGVKVTIRAMRRRRRKRTKMKNITKKRKKISRMRTRTRARARMTEMKVAMAVAVAFKKMNVGMDWVQMR